MRCPFAEWHPSPYFSAGRIGGHRGVVFHHIVGTIEDAEQRFLHGVGGAASAHFGVGYDGRIVQWVDTDDASWHACQANYTGWVGIEHESPSEGDLYPGLTDAQLDADARIVRWLNEVHGIPVQVADSWQDAGISYHSANPGPCASAWGVTGCPGDAIIADRQRVVDLAQGAPHVGHQMTDLAADFQYLRPSPDELIANGYRDVIVYLGNPNMANDACPPRDYLDWLTGADVRYTFIYETDPNRAQNGYALGVNDAMFSERRAAERGYPAEGPFFVCASDGSSDQPNYGADAIAEYARGFAETSSRQLGAYGNRYTINAFNEGVRRVDPNRLIVTGLGRDGGWIPTTWGADPNRDLLGQNPNIKPIANTDHNHIYADWWTDDMDDQRVRDLIDEHLFTEHPEIGGYSVFTAHLEDHIAKPTSYGLTRVGAWVLGDVKKFADVFKKALGLGG